MANHGKFTNICYLQLILIAVVLELYLFTDKLNVFVKVY